MRILIVRTNDINHQKIHTYLIYLDDLNLNEL